MDVLKLARDGALAIGGCESAATADELRRVGRRLVELADLLAAPANEAEQSATVVDDAELAFEAHEIYQARRRRARFLPDNLFTEPAWDMLLDLFVKTVAEQRLTTTSLCIAGGIPLSTGLRWLQILEGHDIIERGFAEDDQRLTIIRFTAEGFSAMRSYLADRVHQRDRAAQLTALSQRSTPSPSLS